MKKTSKVVKKKTSKKTNKASLMIGIVVAILIVLGVGGYFLGNKVPLGGSFNASVKTPKVPVTGVNFAKTSGKVSVGYTLTIPANIQPSNATNQKISCSSSNSRIAKVSVSNNNCVVKGVKVGSVVITATTKDGKKTTATNVNVYDDVVKVTGIKFNSTSESVSVGNSKVLSVTISPSNATYKTITCTSSSNKIATVSVSGSACVVKGVKKGKATITAKSSDGKRKTKIKVTVMEQNGKASSATGTKAGSNIVKFATFNVGYFACGSDPKAQCKAGVADIANWIKANKIDVVGMQEARDQAKNTDKTVNCPYKTYNIATLNKKLGYNLTKTCPNNVDAILSKYSFQGKPVVTHLGGARDLTKVVLKINGVNISFYNSHVGLNKDNEPHFKLIAEILAKDPNPIVITADWNYGYEDRFKKYFGDYEIAAYDTTSHNMWNRESYCDTILVKSKGHIEVLSSEVVDAYGKYSDHNMVAVTLDIN